MSSNEVKHGVTFGGALIYSQASISLDEGVNLVADQGVESVMVAMVMLSGRSVVNLVLAIRMTLMVRRGLVMSSNKVKHGVTFGGALIYSQRSISLDEGVNLVADQGVEGVMVAMVLLSGRSVVYLVLAIRMTLMVRRGLVMSSNEVKHGVTFGGALIYSQRSISLDEGVNLVADQGVEGVMVAMILLPDNPGVDLMLAFLMTQMVSHGLVTPINKVEQSVTLGAAVVRRQARVSRHQLSHLTDDEAVQGMIATMVTVVMMLGKGHGH